MAGFATFTPSDEFFPTTYETYVRAYVGSTFVLFLLGKLERVYESKLNWKRMHSVISCVWWNRLRRFWIFRSVCSYGANFVVCVFLCMFVAPILFYWQRFMRLSVFRQNCTFTSRFNILNPITLDILVHLIYKQVERVIRTKRPRIVQSFNSVPFHCNCNEYSVLEYIITDAKNNRK